MSPDRSMLSDKQFPTGVAARCILGCLLACIPGGRLCAQVTWLPAESTTWNSEPTLVFPSGYVRHQIGRTYRRLFGAFESTIGVEYDFGGSSVCPPATGVNAVPTPGDAESIPRRPQPEVEPSSPPETSPMPAPSSSWNPTPEQSLSAADDADGGSNDWSPEWMTDPAPPETRRIQEDWLTQRPLPTPRVFDPTDPRGLAASATSPTRFGGGGGERRAVVVPAAQFDDGPAISVDDAPAVHRMIARPVVIPRQPQFRVGMQRLGESLLQVD